MSFTIIHIKHRVNVNKQDRLRYNAKPLRHFIFHHEEVNWRNF